MFDLLFNQPYEKLNTEKSNTLGVEVFEDETGQEYTKQRFIDGLISMCNGSMFGSSGPASSWIQAIQNMGKWYEQNIHTYQTGTTGKAMGQKGWFMCPLINDKVADDCSGFVQACLKYFGVNCPVITTATMQQDQFSTMLENAGFKHYTGIFSPWNLKEGDIICGRGSTHTEIYAGDNKSWSWGNIHDGIGKHQGMPCGFCKLDNRGGYIHCWRKNI